MTRIIFRRGAPISVSRRQLLTGVVAAAGFSTAACANLERAANSLPLPGSASVAAAPTPTTVPTATPIPTDDAARVAREFFSRWRQQRYAAMHELLTAAAQAANPVDRFVGRYEAIMEGITALTVQAEVGTPRFTSPGQSVRAAEVPVEIAYNTGRLGAFKESVALHLLYEGDGWRVDWSPSAIFRELTAETIVRLIPDDPVRGAIFDRQGRALAQQDKSVTVGVIPGDIQDERAVLAALGNYFGLPATELRKKWQGAGPSWFVPIKTVGAGQLAEARARFSRIAGIELQEKDQRVYPHGSALGHTVGFVGDIDDELLKRLVHRGYERGDQAGRGGVERWGEEVLGGERGGKLVVMTRGGAVVRTITERAAQDGGDIYLTIDIELQKKLEELLRDRPGSIVVLDPRDNQVLALATFPRYDPNKFVTGFSDDEWRRLRDDNRNPFQNRPVASTYPTGSVFKVVTIAAGLERGGFAADTKFRCRGAWDGLGTGQIMADWLHTGHGEVNYLDGLVQSCNIVNYECGKKLESVDKNILPNFARQFGFGEPTGLVGVLEAEGIVPSPEWKQVELDQGWFLGDAVNLAIGQGYFQATPLQVANCYSALAAGGVLRSPVLVEKTTGPRGAGGKSYTTLERRKLPISDATLRVIHQSLKQVAVNPKGTAFYAFRGAGTPTAAKTGSAENQGPDSHAWFAGYAPADKPEMVVVCMIEGSGAGSEVAAPLGRQVIDYFFSRKRT